MIIKYNMNKIRVTYKMSYKSDHFYNSIHPTRWQLNGTVLWNLCGIVRGEAGKWTSGVEEQPLVNSLEVVAASLCCLRNATPNCARNQLLVRLWSGTIPIFFVV